MTRIRWMLATFALTSALGLRGATVALVSSANPATFGAAVTLTATVNPITATGKVTFYDGTSVLGTASLSLGSASLHVNFTGTGSRSLFARYLGDGENAAAVSPPISVNVVTTPAFGFTGPSNLSMGIDTQAVAVGDFNNDGKMDIFAVGDGNIVSVALGKGDGTFQTPLTTGLPIPSASFVEVAVADFNMDGNLDIILTEFGSGNLVLAFGNGAGGFTGTTTLNTASGQVIVTDLNGDGIADLAVLHFASNSVGVLLGTGTGTFTPLNEYPFGPELSNMVAGDVNGDGIVDLVTIVAPTQGDNREVIVLLGNGAGGFSTPRDALTFNFFYSPTDYYQLWDVSGDGKADLVIAPGYGSHAGVAVGNGDGTFQAPVFYQVNLNLLAGGIAGMSVVDLTGDGIPDVISLSNVSIGGPLSLFNVYAGTGTSVLQPVGFSSEEFGYLNEWGATPSLAIADFNGDGKVDVATVSLAGSTSVNIYQGAQLPLLGAALSNSGSFVPGQSGATFTVTVSNLAGTGTTTGTVTLANALGLGLTFVSMTGSGWSCNSSQCTRSDPLGPVSSYPPITVTVSVDLSQTLGFVNDEVTVSGGGSSIVSTITQFVGLQVTQAPPAPAWLYPGNGATGIPVTADLVWQASTGLTGADSYDVYFGTTSPPPFVLNTMDNLYSPVLASGTTYYWQVVARNTAGSTPSAIYSFTTQASPPPPVPFKPGIWRPNTYNMVAEDVDGNLAWDSPPDQANFFGATGDVVIFGDWNGTGHDCMGIFRPSVSMFALDMNCNGQWDPGVDRFGFFGQSGDQPVVGDWTGDGKAKIGIYRSTTGLFALDVNNNLAYDSGIDRVGKFGSGGDTPVIGDWTGNGIAKVGTFNNGLWWLDSNNDLVRGSGDGTGMIGQAGDIPLVGDWNGDGRKKVGIYRPSIGLFAEDYNGNLVWDTGTDRAGILGPSGSVPVVGDWTGTGITRVGVVYGEGYWALDTNGSIVWDSGIHWGAFGTAGDTPVVGRW